MRNTAAQFIRFSAFSLSLLICLSWANHSFAQVTWAVDGSASYKSTGRATVSDNTGNQYVTGHFNNSLSYNNTMGAPITVTSAGGRDIFVAKFNNLGQCLWLIRAGGTGDDMAETIEVSSGIVYIGGFFSGTAVFGSTSLTSSGGTDGFLSRISATTSNFLTTRVINGTGNDAVRSLTFYNGKIWATGYFTGAANFPNNGSLTNVDGPSRRTLWVAGFSASSINCTSKWHANSNHDAEGSRIATRTAVGGSVYVTGYFHQTCKFSTSSTYWLTANEWADAFLLSINPTTTTTNWALQMGGDGKNPGHPYVPYEYGVGLAVNASNEPFVAFYAESSYSGYINIKQIGGPTVTINTQLSENRHSILCRFQSTGLLSWHRVITRGGEMRGLTLSSDEANVYIGGKIWRTTGSTTTTRFYYTSSGTTYYAPIASANGNALVIGKYNAATGNFLDTDFLTSTLFNSSSEYLYDIATYSTGLLSFTGDYWQNIFFPGMLSNLTCTTSTSLVGVCDPALLLQGGSEDRQHTLFDIPANASWDISPNPASDYCNLNVDLPVQSDLHYEIYDAQGRVIASVQPQVFDAGQHSIQLPLENVAKGVYYCRIAVGQMQKTHKILIIR